MIVSGFKQRNIYTQTDIFQYQFNPSLSNTSGRCDFGFSGASGVINWKLESGRIFDYNNNYLFSYQANSEVLISGSLSSGSNDFWINNNPIYIGQQKTGNNYNYFYINPSNVTVNFNLFINGNVPNYSYSVFDSYYSGELLTLNFVNQSNYPITIFSGATSNPNFSVVNATGISIAGNSTGIIYLAASGFSPFLQDIPLDFYTNFGDFAFLFNGSGIPFDDSQFYILLGPENQVVNDGITSPYTVNYFNTSGAALNVTLTYVSGDTGNYYVDVTTTGLITGQNVSGFITASGYLGGFSTGNYVSGFNPLTGWESGLASGAVTQFVYATGSLNSGYNLRIDAMGSGNIQANITGTGFGVFTFQGWVSPANNILQVGNATGPGTGISDGITYTGLITNGIATYLATVAPPSGITGIFTPDEYTVVNYQQPFFATGFFARPYDLVGIAFATGRLISGVLEAEFGYNFEPGIYSFSKGFTGIGSGENAIIDSFNPVANTFNTTGTTGIISGIYTTGVDTAGCDFETPTLTPTGIPQVIYNIDQEQVSPLSIFVMQPLNTGEYTGENSFNPNTRTRISRNGNTISGSGYFDNVFQVPFYDSGIWTESLSGYTGQTVTNQTGIIKTVTATPFLYDDVLSGYFKVSGAYTGYQSFIWNGRVTGNFSDYTTVISGISNTGIYRVYPNSYNFEMLLKTGTYAFFLYPAASSATLTPTISFPTNLTVFSTDTFVQIPFQLLVDSNETVNLGLNYINGTAINGISYSGTTDTISFSNGTAGTQYLYIPLMNTGANSNSFFSVQVNSVEGGYVSNRLDIINDTIQININSPAVSPSTCPCSGVVPTGTTGSFQVTLCNNLLGNQAWNGQNGVFTETLNLLQPVPIGYNLVFRLTFSGINDRVIMRAYSTDGPPITFFDNVNSIALNLPYYFSTGFALPSNTYAVYSEVQGGYSQVNSPRPDWSLKLTCDIDSDGNNYNLPIGCGNFNFGLFVSSGSGLIPMTFGPSSAIRTRGISKEVDAQWCGAVGCTPYTFLTGINGYPYAAWGNTVSTPPASGGDSIVFNLDAVKNDYPLIANYYIDVYGYLYDYMSGPPNMEMIFIGYDGGVSGSIEDGIVDLVYVSGATIVNQYQKSFTAQFLDCNATGLYPVIYSMLISNQTLTASPV